MVFGQIGTQLLAAMFMLFFQSRTRSAQSKACTFQRLQIVLGYKVRRGTGVREAGMKQSAYAEQLQATVGFETYDLSLAEKGFDLKVHIFRA